MQEFGKRLATWRPGLLARNTLRTGAWNALRVALQAATLVMFARIFGASGYGALSGAIAVYVIAAQLVGLGTGISLLRQFSREGFVHGTLYSTQIVYLLSGLVAFAVCWPLSIALFGAHLSALALAALTLAEVVVAPALMPLAYRYQASERLSSTGALLTATPVARLSAIVMSAALDSHDIEDFALLYLLNVIVVAGATLAYSWPRGSGHGSHPLGRQLGAGLPYAVSGATSIAAAELDKTMMLRLTSEVVTGQYAAASRIMQAALLPVNSLVIAVAPRWFKASGTGGVLGRSNPLFLATAAYCVAAGSALWLLAPFLPWLLGEDFLPSVPILRLLSIALATGAFRQLILMLLTTNDLQAARIKVELASVGIFVSAMLLLIPALSSIGAVIALIVCDLATISMGAIAIRRQDTAMETGGTN